MKTLNIYSEYKKDSVLGSIKDNIASVSDKNKEIILKHLKNSDIIASIPGMVKDIITGKKINKELTLMSDGVYEWSSDIVYYYEKYNLILPNDFISYVLKIST